MVMSLWSFQLGAIVVPQTANVQNLPNTPKQPPNFPGMLSPMITGPRIIGKKGADAQLVPLPLSLLLSQGKETQSS